MKDFEIFTTVLNGPSVVGFWIYALKNQRAGVYYEFNPDTNFLSEL